MHDEDIRTPQDEPITDEALQEVSGGMVSFPKRNVVVCAACGKTIGGVNSSQAMQQLKAHMRVCSARWGR